VNAKLDFELKREVGECSSVQESIYYMVFSKRGWMGKMLYFFSKGKGYNIVFIEQSPIMLTKHGWPYSASERERESFTRKRTAMGRWGDGYRKMEVYRSGRGHE
jgi:hypothetical protein